MNNRVFLFDLDATITKVEILPALAAQVGMAEQITELTEKTMRGELPFQSSFLMRVDMLKSIPVSKVSEIVASVPLNEKLVSFIAQNKERCYIVTGNLDVWIEALVQRIGLPMTHCFCSAASVENDTLISVNTVLDKALVVQQFVQPVVAVGDGSNDADMVQLAEVGIGFGGVRRIAYSLLSNATHAVYDEDRLCDFLWYLSV